MKSRDVSTYLTLAIVLCGVRAQFFHSRMQYFWGLCFRNGQPNLKDFVSIYSLCVSRHIGIIITERKLTAKDPYQDTLGKDDSRSVSAFL